MPIPDYETIMLPLLKSASDCNEHSAKEANAGHAVMDQYPAEVSKILNTFLSTTSPNN